MQVGDYVRTNNGGIGKIIKCPFKTIFLDEIWGDINGHQTIITDNVYKTSPNIIDLIEAGDYVNGMEVMEADWFNENGEYEEGLAFPMYASDDLQVIENWLLLRSVNIKSIVTKEQFENMEYKLGVDNNERNKNKAKGNKRTRSDRWNSKRC